MMNNQVHEGYPWTLATLQLTGLKEYARIKSWCLIPHHASRGVLITVLGAQSGTEGADIRWINIFATEINYHVGKRS